MPVGLVVIGLVGLGGIAVAALTLLGGDDGEAVTLQSFGSAGDDPFTPSVAPQASASLSDFAQAARGLGEVAAEAHNSGYQRVVGSVPGVFGGTLNELACDATQLVGFLSIELDKAAVWASVVGIDPSDIAPYVDGLTAANLSFDTRVLDNGFVDGEVRPREILLQRGSAVLVDSRGVPRVNCYSGNPLLDPTLVADESYTGEQWPSFERTLVIIIAPSPIDQTELTLIDVVAGGFFDRPAGTGGEADVGAETDTDEGSATTEVAAAGAIDLDTRLNAEITDASQELRFEIQAPDSAILTLTVDNQRDSVGRVGVAVVSAGTQLDFFRVSAGGSEQFAWTLDHDGGAPFELVFTEGPGAFEFIVTSEIQTDGGQGGDAGDEFASAFEISSGARIEGLVGGADTGDRFLLDLEGGPALVLTRDVPRDSTSRAAFAVILDGQQLDFARVNPGADDTFTILFGPEDDGVLEIYVTEGPADYAFVAELIAQNDAGQPGDASAELADARLLDSLTDITGEIGNRDTGDHYLFEPTAEEMSIEVAVEATSASRAAVAVLGPDGKQITFFRVEPGATASETFAATPGETHRLLITEGRAVYTISIS